MARNRRPWLFVSAACLGSVAFGASSDWAQPPGNRGPATAPPRAGAAVPNAATEHREKITTKLFPKTLSRGAFSRFANGKAHI